jgi:hypothetical protein
MAYTFTEEGSEILKKYGIETQSQPQQAQKQPPQVDMSKGVGGVGTGIRQSIKGENWVEALGRNAEAGVRYRKKAEEDVAKLGRGADYQLRGANFSDSGRQILAKYGLADYTDDELIDMSMWEQRRADYYGEVGDAYKHLGGTEWSDWMMDQRYSSAVDYRIQELEQEMERVGKNSPAYAEMQEYHAMLLRMKEGYTGRSEFFGQFSSEAAYDAYGDVWKEMGSSRANGLDYNDVYLRYQQDAAQAENRAIELEDRLTEAKRELDGEGWLTLPDGTVLQGEALGAYVQQLEAEVDEANRAYNTAQMRVSWAQMARYTDLPQKEDWNDQVAAGREQMYALQEQERQRREQEAAETRAGNVEVAGLDDTQLSGSGYLTYRIPDGTFTKEQQDTWCYLYMRSPEEAYEYAIEVYRNNKNQKRAERMQEFSDWAGQNVLTRKAATVYNLVFWPTALWDVMGNLAEYGNTGLVMPRDDLSPSDWGDAMQAGVASYLNNQYGALPEDWAIIGGKGLGDAYQLGMSIAQSMEAAWAGGGVANVLFFGTAAKHGTEEALARGATDGQALVYGMLCGAAEVLGETISIEHLVHMKDPATAMRLLKNVLIQGGIEASEEAFTTLLTTAADAIVMGDKSALNQRVQELILQGMSQEEAEKKAAAEWFEGVMQDALGGFLSGGISGGIQSGIRYHQSNTTTYDGDQQALLDLAKQQGGEGSDVYNLAMEIEQKGAMSQHDANRLEDAMPGLLEMADRQRSSASRTQVRETAEQRLLEEGVEQSTARRMAESITKDLMGDKLSRAERAEQSSVYQNQTAQQVAQEIRQQRRAEHVARFVEAQSRLDESRNKKKKKGKGSFEVSASVGTAQKESAVTVKGQEGESKIEALTRGENGELLARVKNEAGEERTVPVSEIDFGESGMDELVRELQKQEDGPAMFMAYSSGIGIGTFINGWNTAKAYGRNTSRASAESIMDDGLLEGLPQDMIRAAFNYGRRLQEQDRAQRQEEREKETQDDSKGSERAAEGVGPYEKGEAKEAKSNKGGVSYDGATVDGVKLKAVNKNRLNPKQRAQIEAVDMLGKTLGVRFVLFESDLKSRSGVYANGMYKDGVIYLDVNAGRHGQSLSQVAMVRTAAHELTHWMQDSAENRYDELKQFLLDHLIEWKGKDLGELAAQKMQRDRTGKLTMEDALDEVVADGCEMMLRRTKVMQTMAAENKGLFRTVKNWLQKWLGTIKEAFLGVSEVHEEARAVAEMEAERLEKLVELWDKGLREAAENAQKSPAREGGAVKYSFAGERAETADREQLHAAQKMEKQGIDEERIRQETGWFRGMDNKWRFEIDDSGMQLFPGGDAQFAKDHPEYTEYKILLNKAIVGTITEEELARVKELEQTWGRELPRLSQRVQTGNATLGNILQHDALFEAYPELKSLRIRFNELAAGERGQYVPESGTIVLSNKLKNETNGTLLHEIQHAIQHFEDFTHGATPEYWQNRIDFLDGRIEVDQSMLKAAEDKIGLKGFVADSLAKVSRGERSIDEHWRALQEFKNNSDQGEEIKRLEDDLKELRSQRGRLIDADEAYFGTAGEIEARDTAKRAKLSAGERKSTRPDLDRKGVVFAENSNKSKNQAFDNLSYEGLPAEAFYTDKRIYSYDFLTAQKPMKIGTMPPIPSWTMSAKEIREDARESAEKNLAQVGKKEGNTYAVKNTYTGRDIQVGMGAVRHSLAADKRADLVIKSRLISISGDLVQNAIPINGLKKENTQADGTYAMLGIATSEDATFAAVITVDQFSNVTSMEPVDVAHAINGRIKREDWSSSKDQPFRDNSSRLPQSSEINIAQVLDIVNETYRGILSDDVLEHFEEERPTTGYYYGRTLFQERDALPDDRALLMQAEAKGRNAEKLAAYQKKVKSLEALERKLQRQQAALEELKKQGKDTSSAADAAPSPQGEGKRAAEGVGPYKQGKGKSDEMRKAAIEGWVKQIQKTEASIRRAENKLNEMERSPELRQETQKALAAWRDANPQEAAKAIRAMREEQESLRRYVELLREEATLTTPETRRMLPSDINKMARALLKQYGSQAAADSISEKLQKLGDFMASNLEGAGTGYYVQIQSMAREIAQEIVEQSYEEIDDQKDIREGIRDFLKNHKLRISEDVRGDIPDFEQFRRRNLGTLRLGNEGMDIDQAYTDLQRMYGEAFFPDVTARSDQLLQILDTLEGLRPLTQQSFPGIQAWEASESIGNEIIDRLLSGEVRERETMADKAFQRKMRELEEKYARTDKARQQALNDAEDQMKWERAKRDEAEERRREERALRRQLVEEKVHELRERSIERDKKYKRRISIDKKVVALSKIMLENSGKRHVPDAWKESIGGFLSSIDTLTEHSGEESRAFHLERIEALQKMVAQQQARNEGRDTGDDGPQVFMDLNPYLQEMLDPFVTMARNSDTGRLTVSRMELEQMNELEEVLTALREAVDKANTMLADSENGTVTEIGGETVTHLKALGKGKTGGMIRRFLSWDNLTPVYFFKRFGPAGEKIFRSLQRGWGKLAFNARQIIDFSENTYTAKEARAWEKETHEFQLVKRESDLSGRKSLTKAAAEGGAEAARKAEEENREPVTMSTAQIMGLYCLVKREQALGHILSGGIRIWDISSKRGTTEQAERYLVSAEDIATICGTLTERQREVADALQKYMNTVGSAWGNEVSRARFGVDLFTEKNYYPIETDPKSRNARNPEADGTDLFRILNMGFTKSTVKGAKNGVVLHSIFDVFSNHMADMAKYNSMGLPMLDAMKWINYLDESDGAFVSVRAAMETAYGKNAERYFLTFMQDLNGSHEGGRGDTFGSKMMSHAKVAAVGGNLRVAALQPTSYVRALAVLDPKYLLKGDNLFKIKQGIREAQQYSGTAVWKDLGFYDMNINANMRDLIKHTDGALEKIREASMIGAELGDKTTWGRLWNATKAEVKAKTGLSGETLMKATAERFDDVIYQTQVMDSTMTRSHMMRQKSPYAGMVTSFMSEPTLSYNLVLNAVTQWQNARRSGEGTKEASKLAARAFAVYAISQIAASLVESIFDALRDDDDYESLWEKWKQSEFGLDGNLVQDLVLHNKLPYVRDVVSIVQGFTNKRMDTEWVEYLTRAYSAVKKALEEDENGERKGFTWGTAYTVMRALSTITGLPVSNTARDAIALWNGIVVQSVPDWKLKTIKTSEVKPQAGIKQAYLAGALSDEEAIRYLMRDADVESEDRARQLLYEWGLEKGHKKYDDLLAAVRSGDGTAGAEWQKLLDNGYSEKTLQSAVRTAVKEWYQGTADNGSRMSKQAAIEALVKYGGMRRKEAEETVQEWTAYVSSPEKLQYDEIRQAYVDGEITPERAVEMRVLYGGQSQADAEKEVNTWRCEKETGIAYNDLNNAYLDGEITQEEAVRCRMEYGGQSQADAEKEVNTWRCEKETGIAYEDIQYAYTSGQISSQQVRTMLTTYGGKDEDEAEGELMRYDYIGTNPNLDGSSAAEATRYYTDLSGLGIDKDTWHEIWHTGNSITADKDENGKTVKDSRMNKVAAYIDGFNLSPAAKDALFLQFYSSKNLRKTPWHR